MGLSQTWLKLVNRKFRRSINQDKEVITDSNSCKYNSISDGIMLSYLSGSAPSTPISLQKSLTIEDMAAIKIQAVFRGHLARRALRALRSLVKLQAVVRGAYVRKQAHIALNCMRALARLQISVRTRQLLHND